MVGVTSVNLGGIEVDVEDVADRLRRLKVPLPPPPPPQTTTPNIACFSGDGVLERADSRIANQHP
jgi:hypothetical protein